jgi:hypothetical protein
MGAILGKMDVLKMTSNGTWRRYNKNGHNSSLSLGRLVRVRNGYPLSSRFCEMMMGYPPDYTKINETG